VLAEDGVESRLVQDQPEPAHAAERLRRDAGEQGDGVSAEGCAHWALTKQHDLVPGCGERQSEGCVWVEERQDLGAESRRCQSQRWLVREAWQNRQRVEVSVSDHAAELNGKVEELGELGLVVGLLESSDEIDFVAAASGKFDASGFEEALEFSDLAILVIEEAAVLAIAAVDTGSPIGAAASHPVSLDRAASDGPVSVVGLAVQSSSELALEVDHARGLVRALGCAEQAFGLAAPLTLPPTLRLAILSDGVEVVLCVLVTIVWVAKDCDPDRIDVLRAVGGWEVVGGDREWLLIPGNL
jgi:quinol monooxygenase YgiN